MTFHTISSHKNLGIYCYDTEKMTGDQALSFSLGSCREAGFANLLGYVAPPDNGAVYTKKPLKKL